MKINASKVRTMKVYVITCESWNGEYDVVSNTGAAFTSEDAAMKYVNELNSRSGSGAYSSKYDYDIVSVTCE
jgi:hypothetical protein